jgi:hypothetical protein
MSEQILLTLGADVRVAAAAKILAASPPSARMRGQADGTVIVVTGRPDDGEPDDG